MPETFGQLDEVQVVNEVNVYSVNYLARHAGPEARVSSYGRVPYDSNATKKRLLDAAVFDELAARGGLPFHRSRNIAATPASAAPTTTSTMTTMTTMSTTGLFDGEVAGAPT